MDISIIVPNYNGSKYLRECLNSLLLQDFEGKYEVIIIDDCSTDNSKEIISTFSNQKLSFLSSKSNAGQATARNIGINNAQGRYICFVDSDDFVDVSFLSSMHNALLINSCDIAICNYIAVDSNNKLISEEKNDIDNSILCAQLLDSRCSAVVWDKMYRKDIIDRFDIRFKADICNEDILFNFDYMINIDKFCLVESFLISYRQHSESVTKKFNLKTIKDMNKVFNCIDSRLRRDSITERNKVIADSEVDFFIYYIFIIGFRRSLRLETLKEFIIAMKVIFLSIPNWLTLRSIVNSRFNKKRKFISIVLLTISKLSWFNDAP